jgi:hypothetical protein
MKSAKQFGLGIVGLLLITLAAAGFSPTPSRFSM